MWICSASQRKWENTANKYKKAIFYKNETQPVLQKS